MGKLQTSPALPSDLIREVMSRFDGAPLSVRIHVRLRLLSCPWGSVLAHLPKKGIVADLGCGYGILELLGKKLNPELHFIGMDPSPSKLRWAREACAELPDVSFRNVGADSFSEKNLAAVFQIDSLYLIPPEKRPELLRRIRSSLLDDGVYVLKECDTHPLWKSALLRLQESLAVKVLRITSGEGIFLTPSSCLSRTLAQQDLEAQIHHIDAGYPHPHILYHCRAGDGR